MEKESLKLNILKEEQKKELKSEEIKYLAEECIAVLTEGVKSFRETKIRAMWLIGEAITSSEQFKKHGKGNNAFITELAQEIKKQNPNVPLGETSLYYCLQLVEKFPEWEKLVSACVEKWGANFSWNKIVHGLLGGEKEKKECEHENTKMIKICLKCSKKL